VFAFVCIRPQKHTKLIRGKQSHSDVEVKMVTCIFD